MNKLSRFASLLMLTVGLSLWTLAPYGGCSCNNPLGPSDGPTPTFTPTHGPVVDDFNSGSADTSTRINNFHGGSEKSVDTFGVSTYNSELVSPDSDGRGKALHFYGVFGKSTAPGTCVSGNGYPFVSHRMYFSPSGSGGDEPIDTTLGIGPPTGIRFRAKSAVPGNPLIIKLILKQLADYSAANPCASDAYAYHEYFSTYPGTSNLSVTASWQLYSLPFTSFHMPSWCSTGKCASPPSGLGGATGTLANPATWTGGVLRLMAVQFEPNNPTGFPGSASYDFQIDNLEFY